MIGSKQVSDRLPVPRAGAPSNLDVHVAGLDVMSQAWDTTLSWI